LSRAGNGWKLSAGGEDSATTRVTLSDDSAWRLLFNALDPDAAASVTRIEGRADLATPLFRARSVIV
jgi:hypothetical protein